MAFGVDFRGLFAGIFAGQLATATFTRLTAGAYDANAAAGAPAQTSSSYRCDAQPFAYEERFIDGEKVVTGDFKVVMILGTLTCVAGTAIAGIVPQPGDAISVPPPSGGAAIAGTIVRVVDVTAASVTVQVRGAPV